MYGWEARVVFNSLKLFNCPVVLKFTDRTKFAKALLICRLYLFVDNFSFMLMCADEKRCKQRCYYILFDARVEKTKHQFNKATMRVWLGNVDF